MNSGLRVAYDWAVTTTGHDPKTGVRDCPGHLKGQFDGQGGSRSASWGPTARGKAATIPAFGALLCEKVVGTKEKPAHAFACAG